MKKKLALLLACTMMLGMTACSGNDTASTTAAPTEAATTQAAAQEATGDEAAAGDMDALIEAAKGGRGTYRIRLLRGGVSVRCLPDF